MILLLSTGGAFYRVIQKNQIQPITLICVKIKKTKYFMREQTLQLSFFCVSFQNHYIRNFRDTLVRPLVDISRFF